MSSLSHYPNRQSVRLEDYDYRKAGAYFLTICAYRKICAFGEIRHAEMTLNELGKLVWEAWKQIAIKRPQVHLDSAIVMPNHFHGILFLDADVARPGASSPTLVAGSLAVLVGQFKRAVTMQSKALAQPPALPIWQRNYYEHVIRDEDGLDKIRQYIRENPARWQEDRYNPKGLA